MKNNILDDFLPFNNSLKQELQKHVNNREQIIWAERPKQGILFRSSDGCLIPFSLLWGGFAFFWEAMVLTMGAPIMALFGIPFVLIGLYLIVGRFFHDMYIRRKVIYALTEKQIIIKRGDKLRFVDLSSLTDLQLTTKKDGSGSILFNSKNNQGNSKGTPSNLTFMPLSMGLAFEAIPDVQSVYNQIEELRDL